MFGPHGLPRGAQDEFKLGLSWLRKISRNDIGNFSGHLRTVMASKGRSRSQLEARSGTTPRLPGPIQAGK